MNYNFTDRVRKVLAMAREEAIRLRHDYVGTEHILLGLICEADGVAAAVLNNLEVDLDQVREKVSASLRRGNPTIVVGDLPYTSRARKVLEFAVAEARALNHGLVETEHLLLGLLHEENGAAARVLNGVGVTLEDARSETRKLLGRISHAPGFVENTHSTGTSTTLAPLGNGALADVLRMHGPRRLVIEAAPVVFRSEMDAPSRPTRPTDGVIVRSERVLVLIDEQLLPSITASTSAETRPDMLPEKRLTGRSDAQQGVSPTLRVWLEFIATVAEKGVHGAAIIAAIAGLIAVIVGACGGIG